MPQRQRAVAQAVARRWLRSAFFVVRGKEARRSPPCLRGRRETVRDLPWRAPRARAHRGHAARSLRGDGRQHRSRAPAGRHRCRRRLRRRRRALTRSAARPSLISARRRTSAAISSRLSASAAVDDDRDFRARPMRRAIRAQAQRADRAASALASSISSGSSPASASLRTGTPSAAAISSAPIAAAKRGAESGVSPRTWMLPRAGDLDDAVAMRLRGVAQRGERVEPDGADRREAAPAIRRRSASGADRPGQAPRRRSGSRRVHARASARSAARSASTSLRRGCQSPCRRAASSRSAIARGGRGIFAQQKVAHRRVGEIGVVQQIEQLARHRAGRLREVDQPVDGLGELGGAARAVAHLPGDEARVDRARPHDARQRRGERSRARPLRIGQVEHHEIGAHGRATSAPRQSRRRRRRPRRLRADRGRDRRSDARADRRRRRAARRRRARRRLRRRRRHRRARRRRDRRRRSIAPIGIAAEQILDAGAVGAGRGAEDAREARVRRLRRRAAPRRADFPRRFHRARRRPAPPRR